MERGCDQEHTRERGVDLSNSRSSSFILEGAGDPSAVRTRRTLSACRSRVSIAMTGRTASAPRGVGRRRRERRPFLAATHSSLSRLNGGLSRTRLVSLIGDLRSPPVAALVRACGGAPDAARVVRRPVFLLRPLSLDKTAVPLYLAALPDGTSDSSRRWGSSPGCSSKE